MWIKFKKRFVCAYFLLGWAIQQLMLQKVKPGEEELNKHLQLAFQVFLLFIQSPLFSPFRLDIRLCVFDPGVYE